MVISNLWLLITVTNEGKNKTSLKSLQDIFIIFTKHIMYQKRFAEILMIVMIVLFKSNFFLENSWNCFSTTLENIWLIFKIFTYFQYCLFWKFLLNCLESGFRYFSRIIYWTLYVNFIHNKESYWTYSWTLDMDQSCKKVVVTYFHTKYIGYFGRIFDIWKKGVWNVKISRVELWKLFKILEDHIGSFRVILYEMPYLHHNFIWNVIFWKQQMWTFSNL